MGFFPSSKLKVLEPRDATIAKCGACGFYRKCRSPQMPVGGSGEHPILFIGEAPSSQDDRKRSHFRDDNGESLRSILRGLDFNLNTAMLTNAIICAPDDEVTTQHTGYCRPNLTNTIRDRKPKVIIPLGFKAIDTLVQAEWGDSTEEAERWAGWQIPSQKYNAWICPTMDLYTISQNRDDPALIRYFSKQIEAALALVNTPLPTLRQKQLEDQIEIITDPRLAKLRLKDLLTKEGRLAFDYETTGLKPERPEQRIFSAAFSLEGKDTWAMKYDDAVHHNLMSQVLQSKSLMKVAANMKFEERWTIQKFGHPVAHWYWDTMLAAHYADNRGGITSLKFQAYVNFGVADYSSEIKGFLEAKEPNALNTIDKAPLRETLLYNGMDSLLEYMLMERQFEVLGRNFTKWRI